MNKNRIIALVALALMVAVMAALSGQRNQKKVTKTTADIQKAEGVPVQVSTVRFGGIDDSIPVTGDLTALNSVTLSS
jgi:hypothetical protein